MVKAAVYEKWFSRAVPSERVVVSEKGIASEISLEHKLGERVSNWFTLNEPILTC